MSCNICQLASHFPDNPSIRIKSCLNADITFTLPSAKLVILSFFFFFLKSVCAEMDKVEDGSRMREGTCLATRLLTLCAINAQLASELQL